MDYKPQSYFVTTAPATYPLTLTEVKTHLKIDTADTSRDTELTMLAKVVGLVGEKYTRREFITKGFTTYRDSFGCEDLELRRSKFQAITSISYLKDGSYVTVDPSVYYVARDTDFAKICLVDGQSWPTDLDVHEEAVKIIFTAGYGNAASDIPEDLREAMLQHLANLDSQRGDCNELPNNNTFGVFIPYTTKLVYDLYRIREVTI